ncbi:MAG: winged helix DNA-binding domain-containing protein [Archangium sp.]
MITERLEAQALSKPLPSVRDVARRMLCLQGQDLAAVKWALAVRSKGATERDVEAAFNDRAIVRSWPLRGTLHALPAEDLGWLLALTHQKNLARHVKRHRDLGLTDADFATAREIAERELAKSPLPREALLAAFERGKVSTEGQRGVHLIWKLAQWGVLCLGDFVDGDQRFVLVDDWIRKPRKLTADEALEELSKRYLAGHGPSTLEDLAWWTGLPKKTLSLSPAGERVGERARPVHAPLLLPGFDEYFLGYTDRSAVLDARHFDRIVPGGNGVFQPMMVHEGRIVGTWRRKVDQKKVTITLLPFAKKSPADFTAAAEAYGAFHGKPVTLAAGT